jgi:hypothetical protein
MGFLTRARRAVVAPVDSTPNTCDIACVSDESTPALMLVAEQADRIGSEPLRRLIWDTFERLRGEYDSGSFVAHPAAVLMVLRDAAAHVGVNPAVHAGEPLLRFFDRINRVLFLHQTLEWLVDSEFQVRLHGSGWERHARLVKFAARPVIAPHATHSLAQSARIQLAVGPNGGVPPRVLAGVAAGGFYLFRFCPADVIERLYPALQEFCLRQSIETNVDLRSRATPPVRKLLDFAGTTLGIDVLSQWPDFVPHLLNVAATGRARSAAALWSSYPAVAFSSRNELLAQCTRYLYDAPARTRLADEMRQELIERLNRVRVSVSRALPGAAASAKPAAA